MAISKRSTRNFVHAVGGDLYIALERPDGKHEGFRDFGDTPSFEISVETETFEAFDSDGLTRQKVIDSVTTVNRTATITVNDIQPENLALFLGGVVDDVAQTLEAAVTAESVGDGLAMVGDRIYQLGVTSGQPMGARAITDLVIKDATPTTFVLGTDYEADLALGIIRVLPGSSLVGKMGVTADYARPAKTISNVKTDPDVTLYGQLKLVSKNSTGENRDLFAPRVMLRPSGTMALKSVDAQQSITLSVSFLDVAGQSAIYMNGRGV